MKMHVWTSALLAFFISGCATDPKSGRGFALPEGDGDLGRQTFAQLQCNACHTVQGVDFGEPVTTEQKMIALGGEKTYVVTYGDLVTSIINPSHRFAIGYEDEEIKAEGESKMRPYNNEMTIKQLIDLVTFLQSQYKIKAYDPTPYPPYY